MTFDFMWIIRNCQRLYGASWILLLISFPLLAQYEYQQPTDLNDGWKTDDIAHLSIDMSRFEQLFNQLAEGDHQMHSMLLIKDGKLVMEEYFAGFHSTKPHDLRSVTKSIRSLLTGIAIELDFIGSVNDPVLGYLPNLRPNKNLDPRKETITIKHLLTMSAGWDCNDWDRKSKGQEDRIYKKNDWFQATLDLPMIHDPGTVSSYCSMGTILLAEAIGQASNSSIEEFGKKHLFSPMGIENLSFGHTKDKPVPSSGRRLYMTPRDMAKIGQLLLNKGTWNKIRLVPEKWITEATAYNTKLGGVDYGYLWWRIPFKYKSKEILSITATGNGGQYIMVLPELDLVAVFTGGAYNSPEDKLPFAIMRDVVIPGILK